MHLTLNETTWAAAARTTLLLQNRREWRWASHAGALLALCVILFTPALASAQAQQTVLARGTDDLPATELIFRINESALPPGQPGVTHAHASGFDIAVEGTHVLTVDAVRHVVSPGEATWVGTQQEHTHADLGAGMRFWFFAVRPASTRGVPGVWPYPDRRIRSESEDFRLSTAGPHDLVLSEIRLPRPGDTAGPLAQRGPVGVTVVDGQVRFGSQMLAPEELFVQWPDNRAVFTNAGTGPARLRALSILPAGGPPAQLPRTGTGSNVSQAPQQGGLSLMLWGSLAGAAGGLLILGVARARMRRSI